MKIIIFVIVLNVFMVLKFGLKSDKRLDQAVSTDTNFFAKLLKS